jgi:DNA-binding transcriptional MerR regulator
MRGGPKPRALAKGCLFLGVLHLITLFSCIRSKTVLSIRLQLSIVLSGFAMDTNPQNNVASRLHHGALNGHADSEMQSADLPEANSRLSTIREMARDFQVSIRTLRFYEDRGLLHPRRESADRRYDARDRIHLKMILKGKQLGFTLSEIHDILAFRQDRTRDGSIAGADLSTDQLPRTPAQPDRCGYQYLA